MRVPDTSTPVVVLRCARHGGLGITRSLGRLGVAVYHIDGNKFAPSFFSRYSRGRLVWDVEGASTRELIARFGEMANKIGRRAILIPTSDATAMLVATHARALSKWFDFPCLDPEVIDGFCSKRKMYFLAKRYGVPTPATAFPQSRKDLLDHAGAMKFPVVAKGIFGVELERRAGRRLFMVENRDQLLSLYDAHEDWFRPNFMLQEFIPGGAESSWMFNGYFDGNSDCKVGYTGRKIRQYPAYRGLTSLGECIANEAVAQLSCDLMKACGYRGCVDIDYRYDDRDGQYKILDVNPRVGATFRLFADANGMDVVRAMYFDRTGQTIESSLPQEGRRWLVEDCDLISGWRYFHDGKLNLGEWLKSFRGVAETAVFAKDDPLPALWTGIQHLRTLWSSRAVGRFTRTSPAKTEMLLRNAKLPSIIAAKLEGEKEVKAHEVIEA